MIDKKKIEEAADMHACTAVSGVSSDDMRVAYYAGFKAGINWLLDNLWHDASEEPKEDMLVLTDTQSIANKGHICWQTVKLNPNGFIRNWSNYVKATKITRWLYVDDLLKGWK